MQLQIKVFFLNCLNRKGRRDQRCGIYSRGYRRGFAAGMKDRVRDRGWPQWMLDLNKCWQMQGCPAVFQECPIASGCYASGLQRFVFIFWWCDEILVGLGHCTVKNLIAWKLKLKNVRMTSDNMFEPACIFEPIKDRLGSVDRIQKQNVLSVPEKYSA